MNSSAKNKNWLKIYSPNVDEFNSSLEKISRNIAHQWILCSEWVPSDWVSKELKKTSQ